VALRVQPNLGGHPSKLEEPAGLFVATVQSTDFHGVILRMDDAEAASCVAGGGVNLENQKLNLELKSKMNCEDDLTVMGRGSVSGGLVMASLR
jgi:hypothetical protein